MLPLYLLDVMCKVTFRHLISSSSLHLPALKADNKISGWMLTLLTIWTASATESLCVHLENKYSHFVSFTDWFCCS